jgi:hypothetical protein
MARERHQNGWVVLAGKLVKKWIGHWRPTGRTERAATQR